MHARMHAANLGVAISSSSNFWPRFGFCASYPGTEMTSFFKDTFEFNTYVYMDTYGYGVAYRLQDSGFRKLFFWLGSRRNIGIDISLISTRVRTLTPHPGLRRWVPESICNVVVVKKLVTLSVRFKNQR
ncbi:hypothetical protein ABKN59_005153 [Abortiporus biennis]